MKRFKIKFVTVTNLVVEVRKVSRDKVTEIQY